MKKKILTISLVVALIAIISMGTLAWFTDEDSVENVFTIGSIKIDLVEDFDKPTAMLPIVNVNNPEADPNCVKKEAWIENTGNNPAYVQAFVAVPKSLDDAGAFHIVDGDMNAWTKVEEPVGTTVIGDITYNVYKYVYNYQLEKGTTTANIIKAAYLDAGLDYNNDTNRFVMNGIEIQDYFGGAVNVYVVGQAIQAQGFGFAEEALATFGDTIPSFT